MRGFNAAWSLSEDGVEIQHGMLALPTIGPGRKPPSPFLSANSSPRPAPSASSASPSRSPRDQRWAKKGYEIAAAQFQLPITAPSAAATAAQPVTLTQDDKTITVAGEGFSVVFHKASGMITALSRDGVNVLAAGCGPRLHLWRAPHRNDDMWAYDEWHKYGLDNLKFKVLQINATQTGPASVRVVAEIQADGKNGFSAAHAAAYTITGDGAIAVDNDVKFAGPKIPLGRLGVRLLLDKRLDRLDFLGRGPMENYADRKRGFDVGLYGMGVNEQYAYEKPMERANHEDVRWAALTGGGLPGLLAQADGDLLQVSALPHTDEQMTPVEYKIDLPASKATVVCLMPRRWASARTVAVRVPWRSTLSGRNRPSSPTSCACCRPARNRPLSLAGFRPQTRRLPAAGTMARRHTDRRRWRVVACTSFEPGEGELAHVIDGDPNLVPFAPPWDDATPGPTNISGTLDKPAGKSGFVHVKDGHLYTGDHRLRLFGSNLTAAADFPDHETAGKVAARMAKFGLNAVRFHFLDATWGVPQADRLRVRRLAELERRCARSPGLLHRPAQGAWDLRRPEPAGRPPLRRRRRRGSPR